ncbi:MAG: hypothetical protein EXQ70_02485 [Solirubrobacterales bacterium]|nr:hypothetical protein [Solirubrobacterales bacterium]
MDTSILWRAALIQALSVAALSLALALALPHSFFEDWGWIAGPAAWIACALLTARVLGLPVMSVLAGAAIAGVLSLAGVLLGVHWLSVAIAVGVFAVWCARLERGEPAWT